MNSSNVDPPDETRPAEAPQPLDYATPASRAPRRRIRIPIPLVVGTVLFMLVIWVLHMAQTTDDGDSRKAGCASHLRRIGQSIMLYSLDHAGQLPPSLDLLITTSGLSPEIFVCPASSDTPASGPTTQARAAAVLFSQSGRCSYIYHPTTAPYASLPAGYILAHEPLANHKDGINVLYAGGVVKWLPLAEAQHVLAELNAGHNPPRP